MGEVAKGSGGGDVCEDSSAQSLHLRDVTLYEDPDGRIIKSTEPAIPAHPFKPVPAVVGITVKQVAFERRVTDKMRRERDEARAEALEWDQALEKAANQRDEARRERDQARAERDQAVEAMTATIEALMESNRERDEARAEAEKLRETSVGVPLEALRLANRDVPGWLSREAERAIVEATDAIRGALSDGGGQ